MPIEEIRGCGRFLGPKLSNSKTASKKKCLSPAKKYKQKFTFCAEESEQQHGTTLVPVPGKNMLEVMACQQSQQ